MLRVILGREWKNERTLTAEQISKLEFSKVGSANSQVDAGRFRETFELGGSQRPDCCLTLIREPTS